MNQLYDPGAYGQALPGSRAVTFAITHDIPTNSGFRYQIMNQTDEKLAYAYILGRDGGTPMTTPTTTRVTMAAAGWIITSALISRR